MAAELITPTDHLTGMPLPILPQEILPADQPHVANRHHHWHPSNAPELSLSRIAGAALRQSRIQIVHALDHNKRDPSVGNRTYHDFYVGPPLPQTEREVFKMCVLAVAGYIPDEAIDLRSDEPRRVKMTPDQIEMLRRPANFHGVSEKRLAKHYAKALGAYDDLIQPSLSREEYAMQEVESYRALQQRRVGFKFHHFSYGYEPIREFFRQYALSQEIPDLKEHEVEEFISPDTADERKLYLGQLFLSKAVKLVADDIYPTYKEIKQAGKLHPLRPNGPRTLIRNVLGNLDQRSVLAEQLATSLKDRYAIAA